MKRILAQAVLALPFLSFPAGAQDVDGRLLDAGTRSAYAQTYVLLIDSAGHERARTLTDGDGHFHLVAPAAGPYRVLGERIGFAAVAFGPIAVPGDATDLEIDPSFTPITMPDPIEARGSACDILSQPEAAYWTEIRKALREVVATARRHDLQYRVRVFERELGSDLIIRHESDSILREMGDVPFAAVSASGAYRTVGTDGSVSYFAPDPETLLAPEFERDRCFRLTSDREGRVGLAFDHRGETDIQGTFWLRPGTGQLARIDFQHRVEDSTPAEPAGGYVEFATPEPGVWLISNWSLDLPIVSTPPDSVTPRVTGFTRVGARILEAQTEDGRPVFADQRIAVLDGTIFDSVSGTNLRGAVAALAGTRHWAATDENGEFFLAEHLEGRYRLVFGHPQLDSLGFVAEPVTVELHRGSEARVALTVPPLRSILQAQCGPEADENIRILAGVVHDAVTGRPVSGAVVSVTHELVPDHLQRFASSAARGIAVTDSLGRYALCGVPTGLPLTVSASAERRASDFITVEFHADSVVLGGRGTMALTRPVARLDLHLLGSEHHTGQISGYVVEDATDRPVAGAMVSIEGTAYATETDSSGAFTLSGTPSGDVSISIRKLGYQMLRHDVSVSPGSVAVLSSSILRMREVNAEAYVLDPITIEARRAATHAATGFDERRSTRMGSFLTREEFEKWNPVLATDVLRRMRGIRVEPNLYYGVNGDTRRFVLVPSRDIGQRITQIITTNAERARASLGAGEFTLTECPVLLFLDGVFMGDSRNSNVDNFVSVTELGAVEVYSPSQVPPRFALPGSTCGVALFWSR